MASIHASLMVLIWTTVYPAVLASDSGKLMIRADYATVHSGHSKLVRPWHDDSTRSHWSRFWSSYLGSPAKIHSLSADSAWEHVIPYQVWPSAQIACPGESRARARVLVYPHAVAVVVTVQASGPWPLADFAQGLADLRTIRTWGDCANRSLDGIAADLRDQAVPFLSDYPGESLPEIERTIAAPTKGDGDPAEYDLADPAVRGCLAGLASVGPPGHFDEARLLGENSDSTLASRVYLRKNGHAVWHPRHVLETPARDRLGCLVRNQADLVTHIAALSGAIAWAADRVRENAQIPLAVQPLLRTIATRLRILHEGSERKTYRSGVAKVGIEPMLADIDAVMTAL